MSECVKSMAHRIPAKNRRSVGIDKRKSSTFAAIDNTGPKLSHRQLDIRNPLSSYDSKRADNGASQVAPNHNQSTEFYTLWTALWMSEDWSASLYTCLPGRDFERKPSLRFPTRTFPSTPDS